MKIEKIELTKIEQNENSRVIFKTADLGELISSMRKDGLLQPVGVRRVAKGKFDAVFGNRRILAAKKLGWKDIDAHIVDAATEQDRDIMGLIENFKRQNTSVAEDGRIFQKLKDDGLSAREIAARLGVNELRISHALDVFNEFPEEFRDQIVNRSTGSRKGKTGQIPASIAFAVNNIRKSHGLNRAQTRSVLNYARQDEVKIHHINAIAPLIKAGHDLQAALGLAKKNTIVTLNVQVSQDHADRFESKYGKSIHDACYERLEEQKDLKVSRVGSQKNGPEMRSKHLTDVVNQPAASAS